MPETLYVIKEDGEPVVETDPIAWWGWFTKASLQILHEVGDDWTVSVRIDPIQEGPPNGHRFYEVYCSSPGIVEATRYRERGEALAHANFHIAMLSEVGA
jgi:hypothetical protein